MIAGSSPAGDFSFFPIGNGGKFKMLKKCVTCSLPYSRASALRLANFPIRTENFFVSVFFLFFFLLLLAFFFFFHLSL